MFSADESGIRHKSGQSPTRKTANFIEREARFAGFNN
jgi:hypothetical protein